MEIKSYKIGDEHQILSLFEKSFNKEMSLEYWNWRFNSNPFSNEKFIELMWDNGKLIGHYAISPIQMKINGEVKNTALSMTTMTHPDYGGQGVFSKLAQSLYNKLKNEHNYTMVWGFPNSNSHFGFNKNLGWRDIAIQSMSILNFNRFLKNKVDVNYSLISNFTDQDSNLFNDNDKIISINKTKEYLYWRYISNPTANYKIIKLTSTNGAVIYKKIKSFLNPNLFEIDIMEFGHITNINTLIELLSSIMIEEGEFIQFNIWDSLFSKNQLYLDKIGFRISEPLTYLGNLSFINDNNFTKHYNNWDISLGYSDVF